MSESLNRPLQWFVHTSNSFMNETRDLLNSKPCTSQGLYMVLKVLEFDFLKLKSWKALENSHIYEKVLEKYLKF